MPRGPVWEGSPLLPSSLAPPSPGPRQEAGEPWPSANELMSSKSEQVRRQQGCGRTARRRASATGQGLDLPPTRAPPASHLPLTCQPAQGTEQAERLGQREACLPRASRSLTSCLPRRETSYRGSCSPPWPARLRTAEQEAIWGGMGAVRRRQPPEDPFRRRLPPSSASRLNCGVRIDWECKWQLKCNLHSQQEWGGGGRNGMGRLGHEGGKGATPALGSQRLGESARKGHGAWETRAWTAPTSMQTGPECPARLLRDPAVA